MKEEGLLIPVIVLVLIIVLGLLALENFNLIKSSIGIELNDDDEVEPDSVLGEIFYLYNHDSEKEWMEWMNKQNHHTRIKAASMICAHLEGSPKHWGYITVEAIESLKGFKDLLIDHKLAAFIHKTSKLWQEYKSIPGYYEKAAGVLARINPESAVEHFREELEKHSGSQASMEKKRILINTLPIMQEKAKDLMLDVLSSANEGFGVKSHALRICLKFSNEMRNEILLETLIRFIKKYKDSSRGLKTEELHFIQDLIEDSISMIGQKDFFDVFNEACDTFQLQKIILDPLIKYIHSDLKTPSSLDLYASSLLKDNNLNDLKKAIAKNHSLTDSEINHLVLKPTIQNISEASLKSIPLEESVLPIPEVIRSQFEEFKSLFFKNIGDFEVVTSEKIFGGVLVTGTEEIEKLYFTKALAKEKDWNFGFIDVAEIITRDDYNDSVEIFSKLRKPYLLYIKNPELFFIKNDSVVDVLREKFAQTLAIQSLDSKSYLVGDINIKIEETEHSDLGEAIRNLRYKYFPQTIEINKRASDFKYQVVERYLKHVNPRMFTNQVELCKKLSEQGKNLNSLEYIFFIIRTLTSMLLVYGKGVPYSEVAKLEHKFKLTAGRLDPKQPGNIEDEELPPGEELAIEDGNIIIAEVQVEQNSEPLDPTGYEPGS